MHPRAGAARFIEITRPPRDPRPLCSLLSAAVRMNVVNPAHSILTDVACLWDSLPLAQTILAVVSNPDKYLARFMRPCCVYDAFQILSYLFDQRDYGSRARSIARDALYLHISVISGSSAVAELLMKNGADLESRINFGPLAHESGHNCLHIATNKQHIQIVRKLLEHGADIESLDPRGKTPLEIALRGKYDDVAALLISHGARVDLSIPPFADTPLHLACAWNLQATVKALLDTGHVVVNATNSLRRTALHFAAEAASAELVEMLVNHGAKAYFADQAGDTALHVFARKVANPARTIRKLLDAGEAFLSTAGLMGHTAFHLLCMYANDSDEVAEFFRKPGGYHSLKDNILNTPLLLLAKSGTDKPIIGAALVAAGADIMKRERGSLRTPLHWASAKGHVGLLEVLLRAGADAFARDASGRLPCELSSSFWKAATEKAFSAGDTELTMWLNTFLVRLSNVNRSTAFVWVQSDVHQPGMMRLARYFTSFLSTYHMPQFLDVLRSYADIYEAVNRKLDHILRLLLDAGVDANQCDNCGNLQGLPPLIYAIRVGSPASIRMLLDYGADVELRGPEGCTALMTAVRWRNMEAVDLMLGKKANVAAKESTARGYTAMHFACLTGMPEMVTKLKESGADIDALDELGNTPLHLAIQALPDMVKAFLDHGANPNAVGRNGLTPLHLAAGSLNTETFWTTIDALLEKGACRTATDDNGRTPLHILSQIQEDGATFLQVVSCGLWETNRPDNYGNTPLHYIASNPVDKPLAGKILILYGADFNAVNGLTKETPLQCAAARGHVKLSRVLLMQGANPAGIFSCKVDFPKFMEGLLAATPVPEQEAFILQTAKLAFEMGKWDACRYLLCHSEYKNALANALCTNSNTTLLSAIVTRAVELRDKPVLESLRDLEVDFGHSKAHLGASVLYHAISEGQLEIVNLLLSIGVGIEYVTKHGQTALLLALESGFEDIALALIAHKANPTAEDSVLGSTALHLACSRGFVRVARHLLDAGADPTVRNVRGETPLHVTTGFHPEMVEFLLASGASPTATDAYGDTPLHVLAGSRSWMGVRWKQHKLNCAMVDVRMHDTSARVDACASAALMVQAGAEVNFASLVSGMTALHWAAMNRDEEMVRVLLRAGANPRMRNYHGNLPSDFAALLAFKFAM
ncbi:hypothetical protein HDU96_003939 [Phlyctochytrium bullatum]|nr:hypothetical protein HDU96_003939 [Phlyctochytrium bullatum]